MLEFGSLNVISSDKIIHFVSEMLLIFDTGLICTA